MHLETSLKSPPFTHTFGRRARKIKGFKAGRTVIPKLLSLYYPKIFLPIYNDQDHFLVELLRAGFESENVGLALYLEFNFKLLKIKQKLEEIANKSFGTFEFSRLLYLTFPKDEGTNGAPAEPKDIPEDQNFQAMEKHYQSLLHQNFQRLFPKLKYVDEEEQMSKDGHYDTQVVGIMDMLAVDERGDFVVIEIKRQASDTTIGQILRYMGWTKEELCEPGQKVRGLIVAQRKDIRLEFALKVIPYVEFKKFVFSISWDEQGVWENCPSTGRKCQTLFIGESGDGISTISLDCSAMPAGEYFYRLSCGASQRTKMLSVVH